MVIHNTNLNIRIPVNIKERLARLAAKNGTTSSNVIRDLIKKYIREDGKTLDVY